MSEEKKWAESAAHGEESSALKLSQGESVTLYPGINLKNKIIITSATTTKSTPLSRTLPASVPVSEDVSVANAPGTTAATA